MKRSLPSPAAVIASLALFIALGGTGYAATHLRSASHHKAVGSKLKRGRRGTPGPIGAQGERGEAGLAGVEGPAGSQGPEGGEASAQEALAKADEALAKKLQGAIPTQSDTQAFASGAHSVSASCPSDTVLAGGGFNVRIGNPEILETAPQGNSWSVKAKSGSSYTISAWARCLSTTPSP